MKELTAAQKRKVLYNYYREQGMTPSEARNMRGRWRTVWTDYNERVKEIKNFGGEIPSPPKIPISKREKKRIKSYLVKQGISKKIANQWVNIRPDRLYNRLSNFKKYWKTIEDSLKETRSSKKAKKLLRKMKRDMSKYRSNMGLFDMLQELYDEIIGISI